MRPKPYALVPRVQCDTWVWRGWNRFPSLDWSVAVTWAMDRHHGSRCGDRSGGRGGKQRRKRTGLASQPAPAKARCRRVLLTARQTPLTAQQTLQMAAAHWRQRQRCGRERMPCAMRSGSCTAPELLVDRLRRPAASVNTGQLRVGDRLGLPDGMYQVTSERLDLLVDVCAGG